MFVRYISSFISLPLFIPYIIRGILASRSGLIRKNRRDYLNGWVYTVNLNVFFVTVKIIFEDIFANLLFKRLFIDGNHPFFGNCKEFFQSNSVVFTTTLRLIILRWWRAKATRRSPLRRTVPHCRFRSMLIVVG